MKGKPFDLLKQQSLKYISDKYQSYIIFRPTVPKQILIILQKQKKKKQQDQSDQNLYVFVTGIYIYGKNGPLFNNHILKNTLKNVQETTALSFSGRRFDPMVYLKLRHIENICFSNLKNLWFHNCYLTNIQALAWLDMKKVEIFYLNQNNIISLKPFRKTNLNELQKLSIKNNRYQHDSINHLHRFNCPKLNNLQIFLGVYRYQQYALPNYLRELRSCVKLQMDQTKKVKDPNSQIQTQKGLLQIHCNYSKKNLQYTNVINYINQNSNFYLKSYDIYHYGSDDSKDPSEFVQDSQEENDSKDVKDRKNSSKYMQDSQEDD